MTRSIDLGMTINIFHPGTRLDYPLIAKKIEGTLKYIICFFFVLWNEIKKTAKSSTLLSNHRREKKK